MRTIPSDKNQAEAMVELVKLFNWTYVAGVYEESSYGQMVSHTGIYLYHNKCWGRMEGENICLTLLWLI